MATLKWKNGQQWETFFYGAFENIKADLKNVIVAINNAAAAIRNRCRRDKNLSDLTNPSDGRKNLKLIDDCSDSNRLGETTHHHDSRYIPKINTIWGSDGERPPHDITHVWQEISTLNELIENGWGESMIPVKQVWLAGEEYLGDFDNDYYWMGWGILDYDTVIADYIEPHLMFGTVGQKYQITFKITATAYARRDPDHPGSVSAPQGKVVVNGGTLGYENGGSAADAWSGAGQSKTMSFSGPTKYSFSNTITMYKSAEVVPPLYIGFMSPKAQWDRGGVIWDGGRFDVYITKVVVDDKEAKLGVNANKVSRKSIHIAESKFDSAMQDDDYYWIGWGVTDHDAVINEFIEPYILSGAQGQQYEATLRLRATMQATKHPDNSTSNRGQMGIILENYNYGEGTAADAWRRSSKKTLGYPRTDFEVRRTFTFTKSVGEHKNGFYMGTIGPKSTWDEYSQYQGGRIDIWLEGLKIDGVEEKIGVERQN